MNIKGEYTYTKDFSSNYSNGVVGGFRTPDELCINFYNETAGKRDTDQLKDIQKEEEKKKKK